MRTCVVEVLMAVFLGLGFQSVNAEQRTQVALGVQESIEIPTQEEILSMANGSSASYSVAFFPGVELRYEGLPRGLFVSGSYAGCASSATAGPLAVSIRASQASLGIGMNFKVGWARLAPRLGLSYSDWKYEVKYGGETHPAIHNGGPGLLLGGRISAPVTKSIEVRLGYDLLLRSSMEYSGAFTDAGAFTVSQSGRDNFFSVGISCWVF